MSLSVADLHVGSAVYSKEGEKVGRLRFMSVDPGSESVSHLVLEKGMLLANDVLAPVHCVERILYRGIFLTISSEEVSALPEFQEGRYLARERYHHNNNERVERGNVGNPNDRGDRGDRGNSGDRGDHHQPRHHSGGGHQEGGQNGGAHRRSRRFRRH